MWFGSLLDLFPAARMRRSRSAADRRRQARRLLFEGLEGRSLLAFNVLAWYGTGPGPTDLALANIDAGTQLDMVVPNATSAVGVRLGNSDATFGAAQNSPSGSSPQSVVAGDFTGDTDTDLATATWASVSLLEGKGDGTFEPPQTISLPGQFPPDYTGTDPLPQISRSIATGDLNSDGILDLVVASNTSFPYCPYYCYESYDGYVNVLMGNGTGFDAPETYYLGANRIPKAVAVGDVNNGDTHDDVITANWYSNDLSVLLGVGSGALGGPSHSGYGSPLGSISLGDVDGDGKVDTLLGDGGRLAVQKGNGLGGFTAQPVQHLVSATSAVMGDVNADGKLDLVGVAASNFITCASYGCYATSTRHVFVLLGNGLGSFALPLTSTLGGSELGHGGLRDVALADLTGNDGLPELVTIDNYLNTAIVATNNGDWNPPPAITISDAAIVTEGNSGTVNAVFTVTIETILGEHGAVSVDYQSGNDTAAAGADYTFTAGTLNFAADVDSLSISVPVIGDTLDEYDEQFVMTLFNAVGGQITNGQGFGTIQDDDAPPLITVNDVSRNEETNGQTTAFLFTVTLSQASAKYVYVNFATADGTATTASGDYYAASGTVSIAPGSTSATIYVTIRGDKKKEANETFTVNLSNATDGTISDSQGLGTILNDDGGGGQGKPSSASLDAALLADDTWTTTRKRR